MTPYPRLFSALAMGPHSARNRIVFGAHFTMFTEPAPVFGEPGLYGERYARYLAARARGGAGTIVAGQAQVHPTTAYQMHNNAIAWDAAAIPGFRRVTDAIHAHGALAFLQLAHNGGVNQGAWSRLPAWTASDVPNSFEASKPLERGDIAEVVEHFGRSARNAAAGGFDGIEVHAAHGYLLQEFLSPRSNRRDDEYGGSLENRMRFALEVLREVRRAAGPAVAVGLRVVGDEESRDAGALGPAECAEIAARFAATGLVDFLNVSVGLSGIGMVRPMYAPHLCAVAAARGVRRALHGEAAEGGGRDAGAGGDARAGAGAGAPSAPPPPVFAVHRILLPEEAEAILERGDADAVTLVRALIADPDWPRKASEGATSRIRRCTGVNQGCYGNLTLGLPVTCVTNPSVGREAELPEDELPAAPRRKRVVVAGGGPAGLEAAWVAAARGHDVVLLERAPRLGGKIRLAERLPGRGEIADIADWRASECARRGVDVRLGCDATVESVLALSPDAVVVATGGVASRDAASKVHPMPVPGWQQERVLDHEAALVRADDLGPRVVILDAVGHIEAIGLGELLARRGCEAIVVTPLASPLALDRETAAYALPRAVQAGMRWRPSTALVSIGEREVVLADVLSRQVETVRDVDHVVIRTHGRAEASLYFALRERAPGLEVVRVGDAVAPRFADRAVYDGHLAGRSL